MMAPATPQDFLIKSGKAIDMEIRVQKKPQSSRVEILPNAIIDPVSLHGEQRQTEETIAEIILTQITKTKGRSGQHNGEKISWYDDRFPPYQPESYSRELVGKVTASRTDLRDKEMGTDQTIVSGMTNARRREVMAEKSGRTNF
ncbi:hypothetical protein BV898_14651 [Hypsibius exemplaris]|uniref:Uncharacterized protein n=1 Tax=Hypsibius exemplaris TaxID=2072580 RepID=A0A9X6NG95_HYPEX|nr:hypothetical protein BV898_14651 [Hypsibius exemplaris]